MRSESCTLIAGDWHLGSYSPPPHARLAAEFLERAQRAGDLVVLNGDVFEGVFEPVASAEAAQARVAALIADITRAGRLLRTEGNHDPGAGAAQLVIEHAEAGRVLVMHGHRVDPMHGSPAGRAGDRISRRFGHLAIVRGTAHAVEAVVAGAAASRVDRYYQRRCRSIVERCGCDLGVFGHTHRRHLVRGDRYANAGCLKDAWLEYVVIDDAGPRLDRLGLTDLDAAGPREPLTTATS